MRAHRAVAGRQNAKPRLVNRWTFGPEPDVFAKCDLYLDEGVRSLLSIDRLGVLSFGLAQERFIADGCRLRFLRYRHDRSLLGRAVDFIRRRTLLDRIIPPPPKPLARNLPSSGH